MAAFAYDLRVRIVNKILITTSYFYASSVGINSWHEDIFDNGVLEPGNAVRVYVDDGTGYCKCDFRVAFEDGTESVRRRENVCEVGTFTFYD